MIPPRDILRKIHTVRNIQQICRAMKTVSSIKLRKAEERILAAQPYADSLRNIVERLGGSEAAAHPLLEKREINKSALIAIGGDKGLAGSYNTTLAREALSCARSLNANSVIPIGRKITDFMRRAGMPVEYAISPLGGAPEFRTFAALADDIGARYITGAWDRVDLVYTRFGGKVETIQLLPIQPPEGEQSLMEPIYEPDRGTILAQLLPRYLRTLLYTAVLSAVAAEHAARVVAMTLATENADELITSLTLEYNKSRQAGITAELTDIVGAAEALR